MSRHLRSLFLRLAAYGSGMRPTGCQLLSSQTRRLAGSCRTDYAIRLRSAAVFVGQPAALRARYLAPRHPDYQQSAIASSCCRLPLCPRVHSYDAGRSFCSGFRHQDFVSGCRTEISHDMDQRRTRHPKRCGNCLEALRRAHGWLQLDAPPAKSRADSNHCRPRAL